MKRLLALLLAMVMALPLCACAGSTGSSGDDEDEEEQVEYPIVVKFDPDGTLYTLEIQEKKKAELSFLYYAENAEYLEGLGVYVDDVELAYYFHAEGTYKERKGVYALTLDELTLTLEISGKDKKAAKEGLLMYWENSDERYAQVQLDLLNGKAVSAATMIPMTEVTMDVEIDGSKVTAVTFYENNSDWIEAAYTFHSNGAVKTETFYENGEPTSRHTYDRKGNLTDEWYAENPAQTITPDYPVNTQPAATYPPETMPTEASDWVYTYHANGNIQSDTFYENGIPSVCWEYYEDGTVASYTSWYSNGNVAYLEIMDTNGQLIQCDSNYENGSTEFANLYTDGILTSSCWYYENGNTMSLAFYDGEGYLDEVFYYYESGILQCYEDYAADVLLSGVSYDEYGNVVEVYGGDTPTEPAVPTAGYVHNEESPLFWDVSELSLYANGIYYTQEGYAVFICWDAPLQYYLEGSSLKEYVDYLGDEFFDTSYVYWLDSRMSSDGYVQLNTETYEWLLTTITGNPAWGEDESYAYLYLAYYVC